MILTVSLAILRVFLIVKGLSSLMEGMGLPLESLARSRGSPQLVDFLLSPEFFIDPITDRNGI
jgi:hypothetical protein